MTCSESYTKVFFTVNFGRVFRGLLEIAEYDLKTFQCEKSVRIRSFSGLCFPTFELNSEIYRVNLRIRSQCRKIRTRKSPNKVTFHAVFVTTKGLC